METRMSSLLEKIQVVSTLTGTVGSSLDSNRTKVDKLVSVKRLLKKLQFLFDLPARLQRSELEVLLILDVLSWRRMIRRSTITRRPSLC